ncbi:glutamate--tRNA ligase [Candidatus Woesearchaeota archaeon]|nr:MAG: glutamate--tRNA ligase [Candidatus Woesearchaeota archaeon]
MNPHDFARILALRNAVKFKGRASPGALVGAMIAEFPEQKNDRKGLMSIINAAVEAVNALSLDEQKAELLEHDPNYFAEEREKRKARREARQDLPPLRGAEQGKVVTRIPPEPSKYNHLGHALSFLINYLYARKYDGKVILRFEDTNPEKESQEFVDAMRSDVLEYLAITPDKELFVSDDMPRFYAVAEELIAQGHAYTCNCPSEAMSKARREMKECGHRTASPEEVKKHWDLMQKGRGDLVLRLKIDMQHKNAVMRDPVIFRVITNEHYRQGTKYKVWPMYDFENALEDSWTGVTHVLRSNEFESRIELHNYIKDLLGLQKQVVQQYGRFNITGATTQGREIRRLIEEGSVTGWDDPRLITLRALKRRGIVKEALYELAKRCGMSKTNTNIDYSVLAAINRQLLDEEADRYSFVRDPVAIKVSRWPATLRRVELKLHPHKRRGGRTMELDGSFYITKKDFERVKDGRVFRLIDTANLRYDAESDTFMFHSGTIEEFRSVPEQERYGLINYSPVQGAQQARVLVVEDGQLVWHEGVLEPSAKLSPGVIVQLERYGFARLDEVKDGVFSFWFAHE